MFSKFFILNIFLSYNLSNFDLERRYIRKTSEKRAKNEQKMKRAKNEQKNDRFWIKILQSLKKANSKIKSWKFYYYFF